MDRSPEPRGLDARDVATAPQNSKFGIEATMDGKPGKHYEPSWRNEEDDLNSGKVATVERFRS